MRQGVSGRVTGRHSSNRDVSADIAVATVSRAHVPTVSQAAPLLTIAAVARHLAVSVRTVERLVSDGQLRAVRIGPERRVRAETLRDFVLASET